RRARQPAAPGRGRSTRGRQRRRGAALGEVPGGRSLPHPTLRAASSSHTEQVARVVDRSAPSLRPARTAMFASSHTSPLLEYLRVPTHTLDLESRSRIVKVTGPNGRSVSWPIAAAPGAAPERHLGAVRLFAPTTGGADRPAPLPPA